MNKFTKIFVILGILVLLLYWDAFMNFPPINSSSNSSQSIISPTIDVPTPTPTPIILTIADITTSNKEIAYLKQKLNDAHVHTYWLNTDCVRYIVEEAPTYYRIEIHEYHNEGTCPGVKGVSPLAAKFYIFKSDKSISYYDVMADRFISFDEYITAMQKQQ